MKKETPAGEEVEVTVHKIDGSYGVTLLQAGPDNFTVTYGQQVKCGLRYSQAAMEFGLCVMHAATCANLLDNSKVDKLAEH